jgi:hypothetical protein
LREQNIERAGADECLVCEGGIGEDFGHPDLILPG